MLSFLNKIVLPNLKQVVLASLLYFLATVFELLTILLVAPVLNGNKFESKNSTFSESIIWVQKWIQIQEAFTPVFAFFAIGLLYCILRYIAMAYLHSIRATLVESYQKCFLENIENRSLKNISSLNVSKLNHIFKVEIDLMISGIQSIAMIPSYSVAIIFVVCAGFFFSLNVVLGIGVFLIIVGFLYTLMDSKIKSLLQKTNELSNLLDKKNLAFLQNLKFLKINHFSQKLKTDTFHTIKSYSEVNKDIPLVKEGLTLKYEFLGFSFIAIYFVYVYQNNKNIADALVLLLLFFRISPSIFALKRNIINLRNSEIAMNSFESENSLNLKPKAKQLASSLKEYKIELNNVTIKFNDRKILNIENLTLQEGDKVVIRGKSGSGKTTLVNSIIGAHLLDSGNIKIGDFDISHFYMDDYISFIDTNMFVIEGTIRKNIDLNEEYSDNKIKEVLKITGFDYVLESQNLQLDDQLTSNQKSLSQGELQRLNLCRVLLRNMPILIIDEATNSIDINSELEILDNITKYCKESIILFVTHRELEYKMFTKELYLEDGKIRNMKYI